MGCGRVGARVARAMAEEGHTVVVLDTSEDNLRRLPDFLGITTLLGDGAMEADLRRAGIEEANAFVAVSDRDARNVLAAQKVKHLFNVQTVVCQVNDPVRQELYASLDLEAISPARAASNLILEALHK